MVTPSQRHFLSTPDCKNLNMKNVEFDFRMSTVLVIFLFLLTDNDILALERKCLLRYHIPAIPIPIPTLRRVVQKLLVRFS